jgi:hypothetical protein
MDAAVISRLAPRGLSVLALVAAHAYSNNMQPPLAEVLPYSAVFISLHMHTYNKHHAEENSSC